MSIWRQVGNWLTPGGWKTYGPNQIAGDGGFSSVDELYAAVNADQVMKLSAVWSCMNLRAETCGTLPLHLRDKDKNIQRDNPLYAVLHDSPNSMMTPAEFWSLNTAQIDMHGNAMSVIERRKDKSVISLEPLNPLETEMHQRKTGSWYYQCGQDKWEADNILHLRGFSMNGLRGMPRIDAGRHILGAQLAANEAAQRAFKQGFKGGGFMQVAENMTPEQRDEFNKILRNHNRPENAGTILTLLKGMVPVAGQEFRIKSADMELLQSRYFGVEEICRLFGIPPQLIGHTDKASSWASSLEQVNLMFLMYSLQPTIIRNEQSMMKRLLTPGDRARGHQIKFSVAGLLRADMKTQIQYFASALQNGYYSRNEVRDLLERGSIEGGDEYTIQLNMTSVDNAAAGKGEEK